jgi:predicted nucleic acid-binding Zn ribbon protein
MQGNPIMRVPDICIVALPVLPCEVCGDAIVYRDGLICSPCARRMRRGRRRHSAAERVKFPEKMKFLRKRKV